MKDEIKSAIERIRALLSRTVENGCTEAEAMTAAGLAAKLMAKLNLSEADVLAGATCASDAYYERGDAEHPVIFCARAVAAFTNTRIFRATRTIDRSEPDLFGGCKVTREVVKQLHIIGLPHEIEIAGYMLDLCHTALEAAAGKALMAENDERAAHGEPLIYGNERKAWVRDFQCGMAVRMSATLNEMAAERNGDAPQLQNDGGHSLVVVRTSLIDKWLKDNGVQLQQGRAAKIGSKSAFGAGKSAGANVRFNAGVGSGQRAVHAIGAR